MFQELFNLSLMNLMRARARLAMTSGGVLVGTAAVILLIALTIGLQQAAEAGVGSSGALTEVPVYNYGPPDATRPLMNNDIVRSFYKIEGVAAVIPTVSLQAGMLIVGKYNGYASIMGIEPALLPYMQLTLQAGTLEIAPNEMVCGAGVQENFYDPKSTDYAPVVVDLMKDSPKMEYALSNGTTKRQVLKVIGTFPVGGGNYDYSCFLPMSQVLKLNEEITGQPLDPETFQYEQVLIRTTGREATDHVVSAVREMGYQPGGIGDFLNQINGLFSTMRLMLGGMGGVALLVAAFGVANTMTMAILERTREIGLMKAIGASDSHILTIFLLEAAMVGFCGGLAGVGVSLVVQQVVNQAVATMPVSNEGGFNFLPVDPAMLKNGLIVIPTDLMVFAMILAVSIALLAGLYPSLRAARLQPVIALKTE